MCSKLLTVWKNPSKHGDADRIENNEISEDMELLEPKNVNVPNQTSLKNQQVKATR